MLKKMGESLAIDYLSEHLECLPAELDLNIVALLLAHVVVGGCLTLGRR
jgi:hypothetical protein